ncbi:MAG: amidinotransferase [Prevotella sp.]|nr:amidinotransferase [Prevotella sp.]
MQTTNKVLMVRPVRFAYNEETATNNAFQKKDDTQGGAQTIEQQAVREFDAYVAMLRDQGVEVQVLQDTEEPFTPDSIFPNNCFSTHIDVLPGTSVRQRTLVIYPMYARNRRDERGKLLKALMKEKFDKIVDLSILEPEGKFLEGTGSLILDREHHIAYACVSPRTNPVALKIWADEMNYRYVLFDGIDDNRQPIYHTNVMMHVGSRYAIVCLEAIADQSQRQTVIDSLHTTGKEIVNISFDQMRQFAGNMLELRNSEGKKILVMSATAKHSLTSEQLSILEQDALIVAPDIHTIETAGGGSARCMIAEKYE